jgi:hypothetical protein
LPFDEKKGSDIDRFVRNNQRTVGPDPDHKHSATADAFDGAREGSLGEGEGASHQPASRCSASMRARCIGSMLTYLVRLGRQHHWRARPASKLTHCWCRVKEKRRCIFVPPNSFQIGCARMIKHRPPPSKVGRRDEQFEKMLAAMGAAELNPFLQVTLEDGLRRIEREYARRAVQLSKQPDRKLVRRHRAALAKLLSLSKKVGPHFLAELEEAGWSRHNPDADLRILHEVMTEHMSEHGHNRRDLIADLTELGLHIEYWLKTTGEAYKKRVVRKLVVEPALKLIADLGVITSSKQLPRSRMFDALFDWIGIEAKFRPTSAGINAIARELEGSANASKSKAKRRTKN